MEKMSYNDRVQMIAEEMKDNYNSDRTWSSHIKWKERREEAEISVAKIYESVVFFLDPVTQIQHAEINRRMIEYGLIPDTQPETPTENNNWKL